MKTIFIVDDDVYIGDMLEEMLAKEGYGVLRAYSGSEAMLVLNAKKPDLVLLDLMLPGLSGEELLPRMKGIPVIVVSAKAGVDGKVELLLGGAADYVTKPFDYKELLARIAVQLRKSAGMDAERAVLKVELCFCDIILNVDTRRVCIGGKEIKLTRTEYAILKILLQNPEQVITKSVMLERISSDTPDCMESSLKVHISHLRRKLKEAGGRDYIESVWGIGFKMNTEI